VCGQVVLFDVSGGAEGGCAITPGEFQRDVAAQRFAVAMDGCNRKTDEPRTAI